jgi:hypothetical protein
LGKNGTSGNQLLLWFLVGLLLIQLESWEAALKSGLVPFRNGNAPHTIEIAKLLGWIEFHGGSETPQLNLTAGACNAAYAALHDVVDISRHIVNQPHTSLSRRSIRTKHRQDRRASFALRRAPSSALIGRTDHVIGAIQSGENTRENGSACAYGGH